jgi:predicted phosphodiesterase
MRIAALYDIHGNVDALEAVLREVEAESPDLILLGGDIVMGPFPVETIDRLLGVARPVERIRGNTDRLVLTPPAPGEAPFWKESRVWVAECLTPAHRSWLTDMPTTKSFEVEGLGATIFCHGTPRSDDEIITPVTSEERLAGILAAVEEPVVVGGHVHVQYDRRAAGKRIINAGSVGMPYERQRGAYWAMLGPDVDLRRTDYDLAQTVSHIAESGFPAIEEFVKNLVSPPPPEAVSERFERMATGAKA